VQSRHVSRLWKFLVLIAVLMLVTACGGGAKPASPTAAPTQPAAPAKVAGPTAAPAPANPTAAPKATEVPPTEAPKPTEAPLPTNTPQPAPTEAPKVEAPTGQAGIDLLLGAMRAQLAQKAFSMNVTSEDGGKTSNMTIEYVAPDSFHSKMDGTEFIVVKGATYIKGADGKWLKSPMDMSNAISQLLSPESVEELAKNMTLEKLKFVGPDLIGGKPMWVYQYETTMDLTGSKISSAAKVWLGVLDKLPYRQEGESDSILNKGGKTKSTIVYEYDPNIKIEAPIQ
jgi:hypothetical protein